MASGEPITPDPEAEPVSDPEAEISEAIERYAEGGAETPEDDAESEDDLSDLLEV